MLLLELGHVDDRHILLAAVEQVRQRDRCLRLPHAAGPREQEHADGGTRIGQVRSRGADALGYDFQGMRLADDGLLQQFLEVQHGFDFVGNHAPKRYARPGGNGLRHRLSVDTVMHQRRFALQRFQFHLDSLQFVAQPLAFFGRQRFGRRSRRWGRLRWGSLFRGSLVWRSRGRSSRCAGFRRRRLLLGKPSFQAFPQLVDFGDELFLLLPALLEPGKLGLDSGALLGELRHLLIMASPGRRFALQDVHEHVELVDAAAAVFDGWRQRRLADADAGTRRVEQADRFIGQLPPGDVPAGESHRVDDGFVHDPDLVMLLQGRDQPADHFNGRLLHRLFHLHDLESAGERGVALKVLLVFRPGGRGDGPELATGEGRLEEVGGIVLARLSSRADHRMGLVDEENYRGGGGFDLLDHRLEPVFKLPFDTGTCLQEPEVQCADGDVRQRRRDVAGRDPQGKPFDDCRFAHASFAREDRVVLPPPGEDVDDLADLGVAAEDRVDIAGAGAGGEVDGVLVERRCLGGSAGLGCLLALSTGGEGVRRLPLFFGVGHNLGELASKNLRRDFFELAGSTGSHAGERLVAEQRADHMPRSRGPLAKVNRTGQPRFAGELHYVGAEGRRSRVARLEFVDDPGQVGCEAGGVNLEGPQDRRKIGPRRFQQLEQPVFDFDVVIGAGQAQSGSRLERPPAGIVQFTDELFQIDLSHFNLS